MIVIQNVLSRIVGGGGGGGGNPSASPPPFSTRLTTDVSMIVIVMQATFVQASTTFGLQWLLEFVCL